MILNTLKKLLKSAKGKWPEELLGVLWKNRTTTQTSIGEAPFSLTFSMETVIPAKPYVPIHWTENLYTVSNVTSISYKLDLLGKKRKQAIVRLTNYKDQMKKVYNMHVYPCKFKIGDFVLWRAFQNTQDLSKLAKTWEVPYQNNRLHATMIL